MGVPRHPGLGAKRGKLGASPYTALLPPEAAVVEREGAVTVPRTPTPSAASAHTADLFPSSFPAKLSLLSAVMGQGPSQPPRLPVPSGDLGSPPHSGL